MLMTQSSLEQTTDQFRRAVLKAETKNFRKQIQDYIDFYLLSPYPMWSCQGLTTERFRSRIRSWALLKMQ